MEGFVVSARKYRPATFDTVVGQSSITSTLKNAIKSNHLAQAFLFCGPRGVGKTTCARILAKTINCFNRTSIFEACDTCDSCKSFNSGSSLNVYELDAASNNSVDDIRNLVDQVRFAPQLGTHKVYIIDEVHMLSQAAFNAFLKTLEEPPRHAIFILATTERHKIIPTILSRCQIFDFNRIRVEDIANHLAYIAKNEGVTAEADALHVIAQKADGALRDACSMFDQLVSFAGNNLTYKAVIDNLNILDYDYYFKVTDAILSENIPASLLIYNEILNKGFDGHNFTSGLAEHFRNLLVCKDVSTLELLEVSSNIKEKYKTQSGKCQQAMLLKALSVTNKCDVQYKSAKNPRLLVELTLMQLCSLNTAEAEKKNESPIKAEIKSGSTISSAESKIQQTITPTTSNSSATIQSVTTSQPVVNNAATNTNLQSIVKKTAIKTGGPSISQFVNTTKSTGEIKRADVVTEVNTNAANFTQEKLEQLWAEYAKIVHQKTKYSLASTLTHRKPLLKENFLIEFTIDNKVQQEQLEQEKVDLMTFLRKELNNYSVQLTTKIVTVETERKLYTASDKFKRMAEKNPAINKLKQQFDLDIEI